MIRSFLPVGQGAFYLERFIVNSRKINVIYDCGSNTDIKLVKRQICNNFEKSEEIHALFLSHLDEDHVNGIPHLLEHCKVKKMFFPLLTEESRKLIQLKYLISSNSHSTGDFFYQFLSNPQGALNSLQLERQPQLLRISGSGSNPESFDNADIQVVSSGENVSELIFENECTIAQEWIYVPFNFRQESRYKQLKEALRDELHDNYDADQLLSHSENDNSYITKIKNAYRRVKGNFNTNSMTLFSGIRDNTVTQQCLSHFNIPYNYPFCQRFANGCLYTGDYDASSPEKWRELHQAYYPYLDYIGCVQVPHHGSFHSYSNKFSKIRTCAWYVISAGHKNQYRHPHGSVLKDILINKKYPYIVTECADSKLSFDINYKRC
jgi:beta-lactamase superfamily II metal-dependent hydrolase